MSATARAREDVMERAAVLWKLAAYFRGLPDWQKFNQIATDLDTQAQEMAKSVGSDYVECDLMFNVTGVWPTIQDLLRLSTL
jgi:hypothetical protein